MFAFLHKSNFLTRCAESCVLADYADPATRSNIKSILLPKIVSERRAMAQILLEDRAARRGDAGWLVVMSADVRRSFFGAFREYGIAARVARKKLSV